jgi:beta-barrel assembly-enhancing protease
MNRHAKSRIHFYIAELALALLILMPVQAANAQRTPLKPGKWNLFSPKQDVELGQQVAQDADKKLTMLNNRRVDDYLDRLGKKLASYVSGEKYPYQFRAVNDSSINAFALPGGFVYINRGTIEAADNEAELAGVMAHEIGHIALRHGTNQATKSYLIQTPAALFGGYLGDKSIGAIVAQIGTSFTVNSVLLKYSRDDERQSDLFGTQVLYDANYDPIAMAQFFEKLDTRKRGSDFFSSHPNPENRIQNINAEIRRLGAVSSHAVNNTGEFQHIQRLVKSLPAAPKKATDQSESSGSGQYKKPPRPSSRLRSFNSGYVSLRHPDNWKTYGEDHDFTIAPEGGIVGDEKDQALAYGALMALYVPRTGSRTRLALKEATDQLIEALQSSNSNMRITRDQKQIRFGNQTALSTIFKNDSPIGGREIDWLVTVLRPEGLAYFVFVAPEKEFADYQRAFEQILDSVTFF